MALTNKLTSIADAIRAKTGSTAKLTLDEMPAAINDISGGGSTDNTFIKAVIERNATNISASDLAGITKIGNYTFYNFSSIRTVEIPDSVTSIGVSAFSNCTSLTSVTIGNSVTIINEGAFSGCTRLGPIVLPDSLKSISKYLFSGCTLLKNVTIPKSVTSIGESAFGYCSNLTNIYYKGTEEEWNQITINSGNEKLLNATIHYNS